MLDRPLALRLLYVWVVSALILTLAPMGPLREAHPFGWTGRMGPFDVVMNVALFVPLGALLVQAGARCWSVVLLGALFSLAIESTQMWIPKRSPSYSDLLANTVGVACGALLAEPLVRFGRRLYVRPVRYAILFGGGALALTLAWRLPRVASFGFLFPFACAVLGGLVASGLWRARTAFLLATAGVLVVCARLAWPLNPLWVATSAAGAALGTRGAA